MENKIEIFSSNEFGNIRTAVENDKCVFCGSDVAAALGYSKPANAITRYCKGVTILMTPSNGGPQKTKFISEGDVYRLIAHSKLPTAERFESWVFDEVLPSIRKHGIYATNDAFDKMSADPRLIEVYRQAIAAEREQKDLLLNAVAEMHPKAEYYDTFIHPYECTNIRITAKELCVPERRFTRYLQMNRFLYRAPSGQLLPYAKHEHSGLFLVKDYCRNGHMDAYTLFTPQGKDYFRRFVPEILETQTIKKYKRK